jgi:drug/metabolite transporter (DMT)-like permease
MLDLVMLIVGVFCCSTAVIFIKAGSVDSVLLAALRLLIAAAILSPLFIRDWRRTPGVTLTMRFRHSLVPGTLLSIHFISWIVASRMTPAANASLIVNLVPVVLPLLLFILLRERINRRELYGTILALAGMGLLTGADFQMNREYFLGDLLCLGSMLFFALYLAWARRHKEPGGLWVYVVPLYTVAGVVTLLILPVAMLLGFADPFKVYTTHDWLMLAGLAVVPTVCGHSILNIAMKRMRGQVVSIVNMGQFVFAAFLAFFLLGEIPDRSFVPASLLVVMGAVIAVIPQPGAAREFKR